jgi:hypothetical protein
MTSGSEVRSFPAKKERESGAVWTVGFCGTKTRANKNSFQVYKKMRQLMVVRADIPSGPCTWRRVFQLFAPSMEAASPRLGGRVEKKFDIQNVAKENDVATCGRMSAQYVLSKCMLSSM